MTDSPAAKPNLTPDLLRTLCALASGATLTDAARTLGLSQSAISLRIKRLEEDLGTGLLVRNGRGSVLTETGEVVQSYARRIIDLHDEMIEAVAAQGLEGRLRLGLPADLAEGWLAHALARFIQNHPRVHVEVSVDRNQLLVEQLQAGALDMALALTLDPPAGGELLARLPMQWIGRQDHLWPLGDDLPLVVFSAPCLFRQTALDALQDYGIPARIAMTSHSLGGLAATIEAGLGIGLRSPLGLPAGVVGLRDPRLPAITRHVHLGLYLAKTAQAPISPALLALAAIARQTLTQ